jgi:hypothetical protein
MIYAFSLLIGLMVGILSLFLIRKEFMKVIKHRNSFDNTNTSDKLDDFLDTLDQMNEAYYEIIENLEGRVSVLEKIISDMEIGNSENKKIIIEEIHEQSYENIIRNISDTNSLIIKMFENGESYENISKKLEVGKARVETTINLYLRKNKS